MESTRTPGNPLPSGTHAAAAVSHAMVQASAPLSVPRYTVDGVTGSSAIASTTRPLGTATVAVPVTSVQLVGAVVAFVVCHTRPAMLSVPSVTQTSAGLLGLTAMPVIQPFPLSSERE